MTMLRTHDVQQSLVGEFLKIVKSEVKTNQDFVNRKNWIYIQGQELGFCNDEIEIILEDLMEE